MSITMKTLILRKALKICFVRSQQPLTENIQSVHYVVQMDVFAKLKKKKCPPGGPVISCFNTGTDGLTYTTPLFISPLEKKCTECIFCSVDQL